jgi:hypothetical protein
MLSGSGRGIEGIKAANRGTRGINPPAVNIGAQAGEEALDAARQLRSLILDPVRGVP